MAIDPRASIHPTAQVDLPCDIGAGSRIWHFAHVCCDAQIGRDVVIGMGVYIDRGVPVGDRCKIQNHVALYSGVELERAVFIGPSAAFTNIAAPRAEIERKAFFERTRLRHGCSIGANATLVCGLTIGRHALVAAGSVVTHDVADYALVQGVPARQVGWVGRHGIPLGTDFICPESGWRYRHDGERLCCLELDEEAPLPLEQRQGRASYRNLRARGWRES